MDAAHNGVTNHQNSVPLETHSNEAYGQNISNQNQIQVEMNAAYSVDLTTTHHQDNIPLGTNAAYGQQPLHLDEQPPQYEDLGFYATNFIPQMPVGPTGQVMLGQPQPMVLGPTGQLQVIGPPSYTQPGIPHYVTGLPVQQQMVYYPPGYPQSFSTNQTKKEPVFCYSRSVCVALSIILMIILCILAGPLTLMCTITAIVMFVRATGPNSKNPRNQRDCGLALLGGGIVTIFYFGPVWIGGIAAIALIYRPS